MALLYYDESASVSPRDCICQGAASADQWVLGGSCRGAHKLPRSTKKSMTAAAMAASP